MTDLRAPRLALLGLTLAACASTPKAGAPAQPAAAGPAALPALALKPAAEARGQLTFVASAAAPEPLAATLDALATRLQLPIQLGQMTLQQLTSAALGGTPLTREQLGRLDPQQSVAMAMLANDACAAFTFKDAALATRTLEELGPETQRKGGASARKLASGAEIWAGLSGRTLLAAPTPDALVAAGALAMEAQQAPRDGQTAMTVFPQALAQAKGMPLATLVELAATGMSAEFQKKAQHPAPAKGKKPAKGAPAQEMTPAMGNMLVAFFKAMAQPIVEAQSVQLVLKLNPTDGFLLRTEIVPLPGSPSAGRTKTLPYALDPKLAVPDDRTMVFAFGEAGTGMNALIKALASTGPKGQVIGKHFDTVMNQVIGGGSCTAPGVMPLTMVCALQLRPGVTPARALDTYATLIKETQAWQDELLGTKKSRLKLKRSKDLLEVEMQLPQTDPAARAMQKAMWGGEVSRYVLGVREGRLVQAVGGKPKEVLERWNAPVPAAGAAPIFAGAAARTRGAEVLVFADPMAFVGAMIKSTEDPSVKQVGAMMTAVPGMAELKAPLVFALWGGKTTAFDLQLPIQSLANVAQVVRPFMGMMGGQAAPPPPAK